MDVDADNFSSAVIEDIAAALQTCEYFSIDLEMSGISFSDDRAAASTDSVPLRYAKGREVAKNFGIIQFGLSVFNSTSAYSWNFHVFPRPISDGSVKHTPIVSLCSAGVNFGRATGIDFHRWIDKGISFVDRDVEAALTEEAMRDDLDSTWSRYLSSPGSWQDVSPEVMQRELDGIRMFAFDPDRVEYKLPNMRTMAGLRALLQAVHSEIVCDVPLEIIEQSSGAATDRYLTKKSRAEILDDRLGFRRVWKLITESRKPLVVHNGLLDLLFCYQWFEAGLPVDVAEFRQALKNLFPGGIFDTRLISIESGIGGGGSSLEALAELFSSDQAFRSAQLPNEIASKFASGQFHEAAYDAYVTGSVFRSLLSRLGFEAVQAWKNMVCVARCYWSFGIGEDRLLKDYAKNQKSIRYMTGLNAGVSTRDLLAVFDEVKNIKESAGSGSFTISNLFIDWIDDASALLVLTWSFEGDKDSASSGLSNRLYEIGKGAGFRVCALDEFIGRQQEFADNKFSQEPVELQSVLKRVKMMIEK